MLQDVVNVQLPWLRAHEAATDATSQDCSIVTVDLLGSLGLEALISKRHLQGKSANKVDAVPAWRLRASEELIYRIVAESTDELATAPGTWGILGADQLCDRRATLTHALAGPRNARVSSAAPPTEAELEAMPVRVLLAAP